MPLEEDPSKHYLQTDDPTVVLATHVRKSDVCNVHVGAYVAVWMNSDIVPIVATYTGVVSSIRYSDLLGIRAILNKIESKQSVNIIGSSGRILSVLSDISVRSIPEQGVQILRDQVQKIIDERPGSVRLFSKGGSVLRKSDLKNIANIASTTSLRKMEQSTLVMSNDPCLPEPVLYTLSKRPSPLRKHIKKKKKAKKSRVKNRPSSEPANSSSSQKELPKVYNLRTSTISQRDPLIRKQRRSERTLLKRRKKHATNQQEAKNNDTPIRDQYENHREIYYQQHDDRGANFISLISDDEQRDTKQVSANHQAEVFGTEFISLISDDEYPDMEHDVTTNHQHEECDANLISLLKLEEHHHTEHIESTDWLTNNQQEDSVGATVPLISNQTSSGGGVEENPFLINHRVVQQLDTISPKMILHEKRKRKVRGDEPKPTKKQRKKANIGSTGDKEHVVEQPPEPKGWFSRFISKFT